MSQTPQAKYYNNRLRNDDLFYAYEKIRIKEYEKNRYLNDDEYKEKKKKQALQYYYKKKAEKQQNLVIS